MHNILEMKKKAAEKISQVPGAMGISLVMHIEQTLKHMNMTKPFIDGLIAYLEVRRAELENQDELEGLRAHQNDQ